MDPDWDQLFRDDVLRQTRNILWKKGVPAQQRADAIQEACLALLRAGYPVQSHRPQILLAHVAYFQWLRQAKKTARARMEGTGAVPTRSTHASKFMRTYDFLTHHDPEPLYCSEEVSMGLEILRSLSLTRRETEVIYLHCLGMSNSQIGRSLGISRERVRQYRVRLAKRLRRYHECNPGSSPHRDATSTGAIPDRRRCP